jgi:hypothetical protein
MIRKTKRLDKTVQKVNHQKKTKKINGIGIGIGIGIEIEIGIGIGIGIGIEIGIGNINVKRQNATYVLQPSSYTYFSASNVFAFALYTKSSFGSKKQGHKKKTIQKSRDDKMGIHLRRFECSISIRRRACIEREDQVNL